MQGLDAAGIERSIRGRFALPAVTLASVTPLRG
jgi:hypothetical protein